MGPAAAGPGRCPAACGGPRASSSACPTRRMRPTEPPSATSSGGARSELLSASEHCSFLPKLELSYPLLHPKAPAKGLRTLTAWTSCAKRAGPGLTGQGCECRRRRRERPVCGAPHQLWVLACVLPRAGHAPVTSGRSRSLLSGLTECPLPGEPSVQEVKGGWGGQCVANIRLGGSLRGFSLGNSHGQQIFLFVSEFSEHVLAPMSSGACDVQDILTPGLAVCLA